MAFIDFPCVVVDAVFISAFAVVCPLTEGARAAVSFSGRGFSTLVASCGTQISLCKSGPSMPGTSDVGVVRAACI